jgi:hypothetical protein
MHVELLRNVKEERNCRTTNAVSAVSKKKSSLW